MDWTLDQLRVVDTVVRHGSFSAAARELHRATSAVSYAIRGLEGALGVELFDRRGHRAALTPAGEALVARGRELLAQALAMDEVAAQLRGGWEPTIRVVLDGLLPMTAIMRAVRRFTELGAPTKLQLLVEFLSGVPERFEETGADAMVALDVALAPDRGGRALPPVEMTLLAHRDHPLHREPSPRTRAQLARHVELTVADSGRAAPNAPPVPLGSPHVFRLPDFHAKREALLSGIGYGFLPHHLARSLLDDATLLPLGFEEGDHHVFSPRLVTSPRRGLGQAAQAFVTHLQEELGAGAATWSGPATWSDPP